MAALSTKLEETARDICRSTGEVEALRRELATIVATVRDIERRAGRDAVWIEPRNPAVAAPERYRFPKAAALALFALALLALANATLWRPAVASSPIDPMQPIASPSVPLETVAAPLAPVAKVPVAKAPVGKAPAPESDPRNISIKGSPVTPAESREPREFLGTLAVQTEPAGAEVFVNRKSVGTTPLHLPAMRAAAHLLWIELDGYRRWTRVVTVPADQVTSVSVQLERR